MTLDRALLSAIGHRGLPFWSPVTVEVLDRLIDALGIEPAAHVLDIGCGDGAMLAHVVGRLAGRGTGVDRLPGALELAARRAGPLRWLECSPPPGDHPADLLLVVGSLRAEEAAALPGRALVLGELVTLGSGPIEGLPVPGLRVPERHGWRLVDDLLVQEPEVRAYEARWLGNVRAWAAAHPERDLSEPITAHASMLESGGLGFELSAWHRRVE